MLNAIDYPLMGTSEESPLKGVDIAAVLVNTFCPNNYFPSQSERLAQFRFPIRPVANFHLLAKRKVYQQSHKDDQTP